MANNPFITTVVRCAGPNCDKPKGEVNRWWIAVSTRYAKLGNVLTFYQWNSDLLKRRDAQPLCSESCACKLLSKFMSDQRSKECPANLAKGE